MARQEVIALHFGSFANFAGAHFWNIQVQFYLPIALIEAKTKLVAACFALQLL